VDSFRIPVGHWGEQLFALIVRYLQPLFDAFSATVLFLNGSIHSGLTLVPPIAAIALVAVIAWVVAGWRLMLFALFGLALLWNQGLWSHAMSTLSLVLTASALSLIIAIPLGVLMAEVRLVDAIASPILDFLQTMPRFVYLIPAVVLLGIDVAPAVLATMTLSIPPPARMTAVGVKEVDAHLIEAANAFGASRWQRLRLTLPLAAPAIMLGINQCVLMALSMVVIASLIGAAGLGTEILNAISTLNAGQGLVAGLGVFILAVLLDRVTKGVADRFALRAARGSAAG
jgi:ABC-type proline/glycine betaine transport system permease subunit